MNIIYFKININIFIDNIYYLKNCNICYEKKEHILRFNYDNNHTCKFNYCLYCLWKIKDKYTDEDLFFKCCLCRKIIIIDDFYEYLKEFIFLNNLFINYEKQWIYYFDLNELYI